MTSKRNHLYFFSIFLTLLLALTMPSYLAGQTPVNFAQNGGVADHVGITFAGCTGVKSTRDCTYTQPVSCSTIAGSNRYTISGYTPTSADIGKHLIIGMSYGINGSRSAVGAGGNDYSGQPLRVLVYSVDGNTITGAAFPNGSPSADAVNSVTNAECDLETDNAPALQALVDAGDNVVIPKGAWGFDTGVVITKDNVHISCDPGAVLYDARNDTYYNTETGSTRYYKEKLFSWHGVAGGGMSGCTYVGTNTGVSYDYIARHVPNANHPILVYNSTGLTFSNLVGMNTWADAFVYFGGNPSSPTNGMAATTYSTVANSTIKGGWAFGLAITDGNNDTFSNITTINTGADIEPNSVAQADLTHGNTLVNFTTSRQPGFKGGVQFSGGNGTGSCVQSSQCITGQSVVNVNITGGVGVYPACLSGQIQGTWQNVTFASNASGAPGCHCGTNCSAK